MRKKKLRLLTVFLSACTMLLLAPLTVSAADVTPGGGTGGADGNGSLGGATGGTQPGGRNTAAGGETIDLSQPSTWPNSAVPITISNCPGQCKGHTITGTFDSANISHDTLEAIVLVNGGPHNIILKDATINLESATGNSSKLNIRPFALNGADGASATVNLSLEGNNTLKSVGSKAGLHVPAGSSLNIVKGTAQSKLDVSGGHTGAGIGGDGYSANCGSIMIDAAGSTINATGGNGGCGIGSGPDGLAGRITIKNGTVKAQGGDGDDTSNISAGAGIGSILSPYNDVIINGGSVSAIGGRTNRNGGSIQAYGIASSSLSSDGNSVTMTANSISGDTGKFNGVVWGEAGNEDVARVYGDATLTAPVEIGQTIRIPTGASLTVPNLNYANEGTITGGGMLIDPHHLTAGSTGKLEIPMDNRRVSLTKNDINVKSDLVYTGANLLETESIITINKTRKEGGLTYQVDTSGWKQNITKDAVPVTEIVDYGSYRVSYDRDKFSSIILDPIDVKQKEITTDMINISGDFTYTGEAIIPTITIKYKEQTLVEASDEVKGDYTIVGFKENVNAGKATVSIEAEPGCNYTTKDREPVEATFTIAQASINTAKVDIAPTENVYNGKARKPKITVTLNAESSNEGDEAKKLRMKRRKRLHRQRY